MTDKNILRQSIQDTAVASNVAAGGFSTLAMCTGAGKTRCAILRAQQVIKENPDAIIFLAVPTQKLRDANWKEEFEKWGAIDIYNNNLIRSCYVSMQKHKGIIFDLVILDEGHRITEDNLEFFESNEIKSIICLTATFPKEGLKKEILSALAPVSFTYTLEQGVADGIVTPFEIHVLMMDLDGDSKYIKAGNAKRRWYQTEVVKYEFIQKKFDSAKHEIDELKGIIKQWKLNNNIDLFATTFYKTPQFEKIEKDLASAEKKFEISIFERRQFIRTLKCKTKVARRLLDKNYNPDNRFIVFCGSIDQANELCGEDVFHSGVKDIAYNKFKALEINQLGVVDALNEGHNLPIVDEAYAVQVNSKELHLIQRIGRIIRYREDHIAKFYIICVRDTVDEKWVTKALNSFDESIIFYHDAEEFLNK